MKIMNTKRRLAKVLGVLVALCLVGSLVMTPALAAPPTMNHQFFGEVTGQEGDPVVAKVNGEPCGETAIFIRDAESRYNFEVDGEVASPGDPIEFYVDGVKAQLYDVGTGETLESYPFGSNFFRTELNLTVGEVPTHYTLTMVAEPEIGGTATDMTGLSPYEEGAEVSIEAVLAGDYQFVNWTAPAGTFADASQAETTFTMPGEAVTVTANFEIGVTYTLTVASSDGGSVTTPGEPGPFTYDAGTVVAIVAVAVGDYQFLSWTGNVGTVANPTAASTTITMNGNYSITANFAEEGVTYSLTVISSDGGSVTTPGEGTFLDYPAGTVVPLLAVADEGYQFLSWTDDVTTVANTSAASTTITMSGNYSITANFVIGVTYTLFVSSSDGGSVTTPGEGTFPGYDAGTVVNLLAVPLTGYHFVSWTGDVALPTAATTTITMNDDEVVHANFAEVIDDLGDLVGEADPGDTIELVAGTYTGNVIIDKPITITGIEGETIISGGIHIVPLVGSNVTLENLIITDYTAYGIWIELVDTGDVFTIRNNAIEGVEGSLIGIQVDNVTAGGILTIRENAISGNEIGIKLLADVADGAIEFNDITGNTIGLEQLAVGSNAHANWNWWGDISGPGEENQNPGGIGDNVTGNIGTQPWLTRDFQTVLDDNIAYFGYAWVELSTGWNIISTPVALDPLVEWVDSDNISRTGVDTWGDYVALGDGLSTDNTSPVYSFDAENQAWVGLTSDDTLDPCEAIYVRMASDDIAPILYSPDVSVPSEELYAGWNLVSLAWLPTSMDEAYGMPADEALVTVEEVTGDLTGYKLVVSPGVNDYEGSWIHIAGQTIESWTDPNQPPPDGYMFIASGYWVFMLNDGTLAGFAFTPVSLPMPLD